MIVLRIRHSACHVLRSLLAVLKDPPILVLDEATSAVDNETEAAIAPFLENISQNLIEIAIAHRLSAIPHSDCIYSHGWGTTN